MKRRKKTRDELLAEGTISGLCEMVDDSYDNIPLETNMSLAAPQSVVVGVDYEANSAGDPSVAQLVERPR